MAIQQTMGAEFDLETPKKTVAETFGKSGTALAGIDQLIDVLQQWQQFYAIFPKSDREKLAPVLETALPLLTESAAAAHHAFALIHAHYGGPAAGAAAALIGQFGAGAMTVLTDAEIAREEGEDR